MNSKYISRIDRTNLEQGERTISHRGIIFQQLSYSSPLLNAVHQMNRTSPRTVFHFDRNNLSHIYVFEQPGIGFAAIPCTLCRYADGLSLNEHRAVRSYFRAHLLPASEDLLIQILWKIRTWGPNRCNVENAQFQAQEYAYPRHRKTLVPKIRKRKSPQDYSFIMARLGNEVRSFSLGEHHD